MKRALTFILAAVMLVAIVTGCSSAKNNEGSSSPSASSSAPSAGGDETKSAELQVFTFDVNNIEPLSEMASEYENENPGVTIKMNFVGGSADWKADLKTRFASGNGPDIFVTEGPTMLELWQDRIVDLTGEPWIEQAFPNTIEAATIDGKVYGMPYNIESVGLVYNKDHFAAAGITEVPATLSELRAAAEKLQAAGFTPFGNGYGEWWILGMHQINTAFAQQDDPDQFMADLTAGNATIKGNKIFEDYKNFLDLTLEYGSGNPLTVDFTTLRNLFGAGEVTFIHQGDFAQGALLEINPDMNIGLMAVPINDDAERAGRLAVGIPFHWVINNESEHVDQAKHFLNWLVNSDTGKLYLGEKLGKTPAYNHIEAGELGPLDADMLNYSKADKTVPWSFTQWPDGAADKFSSIQQAYIGKQYDYETMLEKLDEAWQDLGQ